MAARPPDREPGRRSEFLEGVPFVPDIRPAVRRTAVAALVVVSAAGASTPAHAAQQTGETASAHPMTGPPTLRTTSASWSVADMRTALCPPSQTARLTLTLFPDVVPTLVDGDITVSADGSADWEAQIAGDPDGDAQVEVTGLCGAQPAADPQVSAAVSVRGREYAVESSGPGLVSIGELDPATSENPNDDPSDAPASAATAAVAAAARRATALIAPKPIAGRPAGRTCRGASMISVLDLAVFFSDGAANQVGGQSGMNRETEIAQDLTNEGFRNSGLPVRVRVVHVGLATSEGLLFPGDQANLGALRTWAVENDLWTRYGADDIVFMLDQGSGSGYTNPYPSAEVATYMMVKMNVGYIDNLTLGHELGHNLGLNHDWVVDPEPGPFPWSHGWIAPRKNWRTIMAYPAGCGGCARINYYSDAHARYVDDAGVSQPLGTVKEPTPSNQAPLIRMNAPIVAQLQPEKVPAEFCALRVGSDPSAGGRTKPEIPGPYPPTTSVTVTGTPAPGYHLDYWTLDRARLSDDLDHPTVRVTMTRDSFLVAHYARNRPKAWSTP